ncbi:MBG domain-containing protein [Roseivirga sp.]|uniref:MBG domain-containing protein n=1 Tax=Roseivirga sp. TaxID=1964215 RepID=UPI003B52622B
MRALLINYLELTLKRRTLLLSIFFVLFFQMVGFSQIKFTISATSTSATTLTVTGSGSATTNTKGNQWVTSNGFNQIFGSSSFNIVNSSINFKTFDLTGGLQLSDGVTPVNFSAIVIDDDTGSDYDDFALDVNSQIPMASNTSYTLSGNATFDISGTATFADFNTGVYSGTFEGVQSGFANFSTSDIIIEVVLVDPITGPTASNVSFSGGLVVGTELTGSYSYADLGDGENGSTYQWYRSDDNSGSNRTAISGATTTTYTLTNDDVNKYISFEVTPSDGTETGDASESSISGPVKEPLAVQSIQRQNPIAAQVEASSVTFRVTFNDDVINVSTDDFSLNSTTGGTVSSVSQISASVYDITVNSLNAAGGSLELKIKGVDGVSGTNNITRESVNGNATISQTSDNDYLNQVKIGQSFQATTDNYFTAFTIYPKAGQHSFSGTADLTIYSKNIDEDNDAALLTSQTVNINSSTDAGGQTISIDNPPALTSGETYSFLLQNFTGSGSHALSSSTSGNYANGRVIFTGNNSGHSAFDLVFDVFEGTMGSPLIATAPSTNETYIIDATNVAPTASNVTFTGTLEAGEMLTGSYDYADHENDAESGTTFKWYRSDDASGTNKTAIIGATSKTYTLTLAEATKFISFEVTPNDGEDVGTVVESTLQGPLPSYPPGVLNITRQAPSTETTGSTTVVFRVTFSKEVTNVDVTDFVLNSTVNGSVTSVDFVSSGVYDVTVSGMDNAVGTLGLGIKGVDGEAGSNDIASFSASESLETDYNGSGDYLNQASIGQTFTAATSGLLSKVTIFPKSGNHTFSGTATLSIYDGDQTQSGTLILTQTVNITNSTDAGGQSFAIPGLPQLTQGNTYSFLFSNFSGSGSHALVASTNAGFANGHVIFTGMNNSSHLTDLDLAFQIYESAVTTIDNLSATAPNTSESYTKEEYIRPPYGDWPGAFVLQGGGGPFNGANQAGLNVDIPDNNDKRLAGFAAGDLDADGDMDFLVGTFSGKVFPMRNMGTSTAPNWEFVTDWIPTLDSLDTKAGNSNELARPVLVDIDNDGDLDLFIGNQTGWDADEAAQLSVSAAAMNDVVFFRNIGDIGNPVFEFQQIEGLFADPDNGTEWFHTNYGSFASPGFADLDGDDDFDMIVMGNDTISYAENVGTNEVPQFLRKYRENSPFEDFSPVTNNAGSTLSEPSFADIDIDGDLDLISGTTDGVFQVILNSGTATAPEFLNTNRSSSYLPEVLKSFDAGQHSLGRLADLNGDGVLDFIVSNLDGDLGWFSGVRNDPTMVSAVKTDNTTITITYSENVQTNGGNPTDFTVTDCRGNTYEVTAQTDGTAGDTDIVLTVASLELAVGDITITYANNNAEITDENDIEQKTDDTGVVISASVDAIAPTMSSATKDSNTEVTITFSENVDVLGTNPTDFTVTDGNGNAYAVNAIANRTLGDAEITLTVADLSGALGDLIVTYTNNNNEVVDYGCNALATDATGITIDLDNTAPTLVSAAKDSDTQITLTLSEKVQINGADASNFTVQDGDSNGFCVLSLTDGTAEDNQLVLGLADLSSATGKITITYDPSSGDISDFGGNNLATDNTGVEIILAAITYAVERLTPGDEDTNEDVLTFRIDFGEEVRNVDVTDFVLDGTAAGDGTIANVQAVTVGIEDSRYYDVQVTGLGASNGTVSLGVKGTNGLSGSNNILNDNVIADVDQTVNAEQINSGTPAAQSFQPTQDGELVAIRIKLNETSTYTGNMTLKIREGDGVGGNVLTTQDFSALSGIAAEYMTINLDNPVDVTGGQSYTFHFDHPNAGDFVPEGSNTNPYANGRMYGAFEAPNFDWAFTTYITSGSTYEVATSGNTMESYTLDNISPSVVITSNANNPQSGVFTATFTFSEDVTGFAQEDISVGNGEASNFNTASSLVYTATITPTSDGEVTVDVAADKVSDAAGNNNTKASQLSINNDETSPTVTITSDAGDPQSGAFTTTFTFSEVVSGFTSGDITVSNAVVNHFDNTNAPQYTAIVTPSADGTVTVDVNAGIAQDAAGNDNLPASQLSITNDETAPGRITGSIVGKTYGLDQNMDIVVEYNEVVLVETTGGTPAINISMGGQTREAAYLSGSGTTSLTFRYTTVSGDFDGNGVSLSSIQLNGGLITDGARNNAELTGTHTGDSDVRVDTTIPSLNITSSSNRTSGAFTATFTFSEDVSGFAIDDISVKNGTAGNFNTTSAKVYTATITPNADGEVTVDVAANKAQDAGGNGNTVATQLSVTNDETAPTVTITSNANDPHNGAFTATFTFSEDVTGFDVNDISVTNGVASNFNTTSASVYTATITPSADGTVTVDVNTAKAQDLAGNNNTAATQFSITNDETAPTVLEVTSDVNNSTFKLGDEINIYVQYSEEVFVTGTPQLELETGTTDRTIDYVDRSASTLRFVYEVKAGDESSDLDVTSSSALTLNGGTIVDVVGLDANLTVKQGSDGGALTEKNLVIDGVVPNVTITSNANDPQSGAFTATFTFSENVSGFSGNDITVGNGVATNFNTVSAKIYTATITPAADGEVTLDVASDKASDVVGNGNVAATQLSLTNDETSPMVTITSNADPTSGAFTVTFTFSEEVTGFDLSDITASNGTASNFNTSSTSIYTAKITPVAEGAVTVSIGADLAKDAAGNNNTASTQLSITNDETAPTLVNAVKSSNTGLTLTFNEAVKTMGIHPTDFTVRDGNSTNFTVQSISDGTAGDDELILTFNDLSAAELKLEITYSNNNGVVTDLAGNTLGSTRSGVVISLNAIPTVSQVDFSGILTVGETLTGAYTYADLDNDAEDGTAFKWYRSDDANGTNKTAILGAADQTYELTSDDVDHYISFEVTPNDGKNAGTTVESGLQGGVNKISQAITFNALTDKTYGDASFNLGATASSNLGLSYASSNANVATVSGSTVTIVGAGTATITASQAGDASYAAATDAVQTLTVNKAELIATAEDKSKTYGEDNPVFTISYTGFVNGEDETAITTEPTTSTTADATTGVGTYDIALSGGTAYNYSLITNNGSLTISKATLTATAEDKSKTYGDENPGFTISYSGFVNGDDETAITTVPTASTTADATTGVGVYAIALTGGEADNYSLSTNNGSLTIGKATLTAAAEDKSKTYGEENPSFTVSYSGFVNGDNVTAISTAPTASTTADASTGVGTYDIILSGGTADNYSLITNNGSLTIGKAILTATADDKSKTYGEENPSFTVSYSGFVNGENETAITTKPTASTTSDATSDAGVYDITLTGGTADNYSLITNNGSLTIGKATLTATAEDKSKTYGEENPSFTITYSGFVNGDDISEITEPTASTTADATTGVGVYAIALTGGTADNYSLIANNGSLTIGKATLTATAEDKTKVKGQTNPEFTIVYSGFVNGDNEEDIDRTPTATSTADETTGAGTAAISLSGGIDDNYSFDLVDGTLTILDAAFISSVTGPADDTYGIGDELEFTINFSLAVSTSGTISLPFTLGTDSKTASLVADVTSETELKFSYTVAEGDLDTDGLTLGSALSVSGSIKDDLDTDAILELNQVADLSGVLIDGVRPSPTITSDAGALTNAAFTATFTYDEAVNGLDINDITLTNGTASDFATITAGMVWSATITPSTDGTTTVTLNSGAATDIAGNKSEAGNTISTVFDGTAPQVSSIVRAEADQIPTGTTSRDFTVTFSEEVAGVDVTDFEVVTTGAATASLNTVTVIDAKTYTIEVNGISGEGTIGLNTKANSGIVDKAGNALKDAFTGEVYATNFAPTDIGLSASSIQENNSVGDDIGVISTTDADADDSFTYSLVSGAGDTDTDNASFMISGDMLQAAAAFDFETKDSYSIRVKTDDGFGGTFEKVLTITVTNETEAQIEVSGNGNFDQTGLGLSSMQSWTLTNNGDAATEIRVTSTSTAFSITPGSVIIGAGESETVTAVFTPQAAETYNGTATFNYNVTSETEGNVTVSLTGEGVIVTGLDEGQIKEDQISVFPNPASSYITIDLSELRGMPLDIRLINPAGVSRLEKDGYNQLQLRIDVTNYESGLYIIQFSNERSLVRKKILIRK